MQQYASWLLRVCILLEMGFLLAFGAGVAGHQSGGWFLENHLFVFLFGPPVLTNLAILALRRLRFKPSTVYFLASILCFIACVFFLFENMALSGAVEGIQ